MSTVDSLSLDRILQEAIEVLENSKEQIFDIAEHAREECLRLEKEMNHVKQLTLKVIDEVDRCEKEVRLARLHLMKVNKELGKYSEEEMRQAYEKVAEMQIKVALLRERENQLKAKRTELEISHQKMRKTAEKAEKLVTQVGVAISYLASSVKNIWEEIEKLQQQQQVGYAIIRAQEEERRRIARGIHDGPAQSLANLVLRAEYCEKLLDKKPELLKEELQALKRFARSNLEDIRKIIFDLRPMDLDDLGLIPAIQRYASDFALDHQIPVEVVVLGDRRRFSAAMEVALFRIVQEALTNISKHARATQANIVIEITPLNITLVIKDNGIGFNVEEPLDNECFGLRGMKEWVAFLRGNIKITSQPGAGTTINVKIPVEGEEWS
ncbi:MAG TPA: histidine kinase [Clostridia bacterium]|nr:histidine kinase [Clostridia bacterium]